MMFMDLEEDRFLVHFCEPAVALLEVWPISGVVWRLPHLELAFSS